MADVDPEIFISYAHADNEYPRYESRDWEGSRGWVECFYDALRKRLQQLRRGTEIWRDGDGRIRGASALTPAIEHGIANASVLLTINSPAYAASTWCETELRLFRESTTTRFGGLRAGNMLRVFKINKLPAPGDSFFARDPDLADNTGYAFYRSVEGSPLEYEPMHGGEPGTRFLAAVNGVACDIVKVLQGHAAVVTPSGLTVYLAETAPDMAGVRTKLQGELEQYGHAILPAAGDARGADYAARVSDDLSRARLSVHVIGGESGSIRDDAGGRTDAEIQYDAAAAEVERRTDFARVTWLAPLEAAPDPAMAVFREKLRATDPTLLIASIEDLRTLVKRQLEAKPEAPPATDGAVRIVYLMFDASDDESARPVIDWLFDQGFEVLKPARTGNLLKAHRVNLRDSHGALIYYGEVDDDWLAVKLGDLRKSLADRGKAQQIRGAVYLADPVLPGKNDFRSRLFDVIPGFGRFRPELLQEFVAKVRAAGAP